MLKTKPTPVGLLHSRRTHGISHRRKTLAHHRQTINQKTITNVFESNLPGPYRYFVHRLSSVDVTDGCVLNGIEEFLKIQVIESKFATLKTDPENDWMQHPQNHHADRKFELFRRSEGQLYTHYTARSGNQTGGHALKTMAIENLIAQYIPPGTFIPLRPPAAHHWTNQFERENRWASNAQRREYRKAGKNGGFELWQTISAHGIRDYGLRADTRMREAAAASHAEIDWSRLFASLKPPQTPLESPYALTPSDPSSSIPRANHSPNSRHGRIHNPNRPQHAPD